MRQATLLLVALLAASAAAPARAQDVPDIAGSLTQWHDHQNLCWDETGTRIVGVLQNGVCTAGVFRPTPPMMHVWLEDTPCGPFATVENHGGGCTVHH